MKRSETVSLLSLWICVGVALRNCPKDTLFFYALVPTCDGAADELSCDYLVRGALELAVQHLKQESSILENITPQVSLFEKDNVSDPRSICCAFAIYTSAETGRR